MTHAQVLKLLQQDSFNRLLPLIFYNIKFVLKAGIGKPQIRGFTLPPEEFVYGITYTGKNFGTADSKELLCF